MEQKYFKWILKYGDPHSPKSEYLRENGALNLIKLYFKIRGNYDRKQFYDMVGAIQRLIERNEGNTGVEYEFPSDEYIRIEKAEKWLKEQVWSGKNKVTPQFIEFVNNNLGYKK